MTGKNTTSWSWLHRIGVPASMVVAEATWTSVLVGAALAAAHGPHVSLPFLAYAVPAVLAALAGAAVSRLGWSWWWQVVALIPIAVIATMLTAGTISSLTTTSLWWQVTTQPWTVTGHPAAVTAAAAWFVSALACGRGIWVGVAQPSFHHAVASFAVGAAAFLGIFAGRADGHAATFLDATSVAGWLFFLWFPLAAACVALVRQRDLEHAVLSRVGSRPSSVWLTVLAVPMLAVAALALLLAALVGPAAPSVGRGVASAVLATWHGILAVGGWLADLFSGGKGTHPSGRTHPAQPSPTPTHTTVPKQVAAPSHPIHLPLIVWIVLIAVVVVAVSYLANRIVQNRNPGQLAKWKPPVVTVDEQRDSVFSWRHLGAQLRGVARTFFSSMRHRQRPRTAGADTGLAPDASGGAETVRQAYRRMLLAARTAGHGRGASETTRELQARLTADFGTNSSLGELTDLYDSVRYGEADLDASASSHAAQHADVVAGAMQVEQPISS